MGMCLFIQILRIEMSQEAKTHKKKKQKKKRPKKEREKIERKKKTLAKEGSQVKGSNKWNASVTILQSKQREKRRWE